MPDSIYDVDVRGEEENEKGTNIIISITKTMIERNN